MNIEYIEKVKEIRAFANGGEDYFESDKEMIPYTSDAIEMYEELCGEYEFRSIQCAEVVVFRDYYKITNVFSADFPERFERFKAFANTKNYVKILKNDTSGVNKREQATQIFKALKTIPSLLYGNAKNSKLLPECAILVTQMLYDFGDSLMEYFPEDSAMINIAVKAWKEGIRRQTQWKHWKVDKRNFDTEKMQEYVKKVKSKDKDYNIPKQQSSLSVWWKGLDD